MRHRYDMIYRCNSSPLAATAAHSRAQVLYGEYGIASRDTVAVRWQVGRKETIGSLPELEGSQNTVRSKRNRIELAAESRYPSTFLTSRQVRERAGSVPYPYP